MTTPSDAERARRQHSVDVALHSTALEGGQVSDKARADLADYVAGLVDIDELIERARARYSITD